MNYLIMIYTYKTAAFVRDLYPVSLSMLSLSTSCNYIQLHIQPMRPSAKLRYVLCMNWHTVNNTQA